MKSCTFMLLGWWHLMTVARLWIFTKCPIISSFHGPTVIQTVLALEGAQLGLRGSSWGWGDFLHEGIISSGCCRVPELSLEHMWGWRSAGSWLFVLRPPSSSRSLPLSAAASPAWKTSHSLCQGVPLCGYCSALQESEPQKSMKYRSIENTFQLQCCWNLQCLTWT